MNSCLLQSSMKNSTEKKIQVWNFKNHGKVHNSALTLFIALVC